MISIKSLIKFTTTKLYKYLIFPYYYLFFFFKKKFTSVVLISDYANWVYDQYMRTFSKFLKNILNLSIVKSSYIPNFQYIYLLDQYQILKINFFNNIKKVIALDYMHGLHFHSPYNKRLLKFIILNQNKIKIIRVTNSYFKKYLVKQGIDKKKIFTIPTSISNSFKYCDKKDVKKFKEKYNIPSNFFIIGSFQKDGNGWMEGGSPKSIKGPDIFVKTVKILNKKIKNLLILLTGPARGYIKNELKKNNISYLHLKELSNDQMKFAYSCLDLYLITSRDEGGPMSIFESMTMGVPVVSTRVGHAHDHIKNFYNGFKTNVNNYKQLSYYGYLIYSDNKLRKKIIQNGKLTAKKNLFAAQTSHWKNFFRTFINKNS